LALRYLDPGVPRRLCVAMDPRVFAKNSCLGASDCAAGQLPARKPVSATPVTDHPTTRCHPLAGRDQKHRAHLNLLTAGRPNYGAIGRAVAWLGELQEQAEFRRTFGQASLQTIPLACTTRWPDLAPGAWLITSMICWLRFGEESGAPDRPCGRRAISIRIRRNRAGWTGIRAIVAGRAKSLNSMTAFHEFPPCHWFMRASQLLY
jgi:hypothetical protein